MQNVDRMRKVYESVLDIDLTVGLLLEQKDGTYIGPVGQCLLLEQFHRYKYGDRFFYDFKENPHQFNKGKKESNMPNYQYNTFFEFKFKIKWNPLRNIRLLVLFVKHQTYLKSRKMHF